MEIRSVVFLSICVTYVFGGHIESGRCPVLPETRDFDLNKFYGEWKSISRLSSDTEKDDLSCESIKYTHKFDHKVEFLIRHRKAGGKTTQQISTGEKTYIKNMLEMRKDHFSPEYHHWMFQYQNYTYGLLVSCSEALGLFHIERVWIVSRSSTVDQSTMREIRNDLSRMGLGSRKFSPVSHENCNENDPREHSEKGEDDDDKETDGYEFFEIVDDETDPKDEKDESNDKKLNPEEGSSDKKSEDEKDGEDKSGDEKLSKENQRSREDTKNEETAPVNEDVGEGEKITGQQTDQKLEQSEKVNFNHKREVPFTYEKRDNQGMVINQSPQSGNDFQQQDGFKVIYDRGDGEQSSGNVNPISQQTSNLFNPSAPIDFAPSNNVVYDRNEGNPGYSTYSTDQYQVIQPYDISAYLEIIERWKQERAANSDSSPSSSDSNGGGNGRSERDRERLKQIKERGGLTNSASDIRRQKEKQKQILKQRGFVVRAGKEKAGGLGGAHGHRHR